jgi:hypothetical protein
LPLATIDGANPVIAKEKTRVGRRNVEQRAIELRKMNVLAETVFSAYKKDS